MAARLTQIRAFKIAFLCAGYFTLAEATDSNYLRTASGDSPAPAASGVSGQLTENEAARIIESLGGRVSFDCVSKNGRITWVDLNGVAITDTELKLLQSFKTIKRITLGPKEGMPGPEVEISAKGWDYLRRLQSLRQLWIAGPMPDQQAAECLRQLDQLNSIELHVTKIGNRDPAVLKGLDSLVHLWLDDPELDGRTLSRFPALPHLERLSLSSPRLRPYHLRYLDRFPGVRSLALHGFTLSDEGLKHLAVLRNLESIRGSASAGYGSPEFDSLTERGLSSLQTLVHLKSITGFPDRIVRAWVTAEKCVACPWTKSKDGRLSLRLLVPAESVSGTDSLWVIIELCNNSRSPLTVFRPVGAMDEACRRISLEGPSGPVECIASSYAPHVNDQLPEEIGIPPRCTIRDFLELPVACFPGTDQADAYKVSYNYHANLQASSRTLEDLVSIWQGSIQSQTATIRKN